MATSIKILRPTAFFLLLLQNAWAVCLNGHPSVAKEYRQSRAVFIAEVLSEKPEGPSDGFLDGASYVIRVREVFRGKPSQALNLFSENSSGRFPMKVNEAYLLFVYQQSGRMMVDNCGNSKLLSLASKDVAEIRKLEQKRLPADRPVVWARPAALEHRADVLEAAAILRDFAASNYSNIQSRCFGFELEEISKGSYDFALRFNERVCGGTSPSNLLDRYRVVSATRIIFWYDPAEGQFTKRVQ